MNTLPQTVEEVTQTIMGDNKSLVQSAFGAIITDEKSHGIAVDILSTIKERLKSIETKRTEMVKPLNDHVKILNAGFKAAAEPLQDADKSLRPKVTAFQQKLESEKHQKAEEERKRREEELLAAADKKEEEGNTEGAGRLLDMAVSVKAKVEESGRGGFTGAKSSLVSRWVFEVTDIQALARENPELIMVDSVKVNALIKSGVRELAGVNIRQEQTLSVRG